MRTRGFAPLKVIHRLIFLYGTSPPPVRTSPPPQYVTSPPPVRDIAPPTVRDIAPPFAHPLLFSIIHQVVLSNRSTISLARPVDNSGHRRQHDQGKSRSRAIEMSSLRSQPRALNWGLRPQTPTRGLHPWTRMPKEQKPRPRNGGGQARRSPRAAARTRTARARAKTRAAC